MASSSKGRASSRKQKSTGKARAISVRRKDTLPRTGTVPAGRRKPLIQPPFDAPTEPLATAGMGSKKKAHRLQQTGTAASRTKTTRAAGRASGKLKKPAAVEAPSMVAPALAPAMVTALEPAAETVGAAEPAPTADEVGAMTALEAPEVEALAIFDTETEVDASAIVEEATIGEPPPLPVRAVTFPSTAIGQRPFSDETRGPSLVRMAAESPARAEPAPHHGKRALMTVASRLLSTLCRWTGVRL